VDDQIGRVVVEAKGSDLGDDVDLGRWPQVDEFAKPGHQPAAAECGQDTDRQFSSGLPLGHQAHGADPRAVQDIGDITRILLAEFWSGAGVGVRGETACIAAAIPGR
jgi:hypothetical protein